MAAPDRARTFASSVYYLDPMAAVEWLERAFGFERSMMITEPDGALTHAELSFGDGHVTIGAEWADWTRSPASIGGKCSQNLSVQLDDDVDAHCARARAAGAVIQQEPEDQFYGDRTYRAADPEGHIWSFARTIRFVSREEAEAASGLTIEGWR